MKMSSWMVWNFFSYVVCSTTLIKFYEQRYAFGTRNSFVAVIVIAVIDICNENHMFYLRQTDSFDADNTVDVYGEISFVVSVWWTSH